MTTLSPALDSLLEYLVQKASPAEIMAFTVSEDAQQHAHELMERQNAGTLTPAEKTELDQVLEVERLVAMLKARALVALDKS